MGKFERIANKAQFAVAILRNPSFSEFELLDLDAKSSEETRQKLADRGFYFIGAIGLVEGAPIVALTEPLNATISTALSQSFLQIVENRINAILAANADDLAWLNRIHQSPDTREN